MDEYTKNLTVSGIHGEIYTFASFRPLDDIEKLRGMLAVIGSGIEKRASSIPGAGDGIFASRAFRKNEIVTFYDGVIVPASVVTHAPEAERAVLMSHARQLITAAYVLIGNYHPRTGLHVTDQTDTSGLGGGSFLNDVRGPNRHSPAMPNVEFANIDDNTNKDLVRSASNYRGLSPFHRMVAVVALRPIANGEELYVDYGDSYWQAQADKEDDDDHGDAVVRDIRPYAVTRQAAEAQAAAEAAAVAARHATARRITLVPMPLVPGKTAREDPAPPARAAKSQRILPSSVPGRPRKQ